MEEPPPPALPPVDDRATRRPMSMWMYIGAGAAMIIWSGVKIVVWPFRR